jgi:sec-independent protein translocase protein TatB
MFGIGLPEMILIMALALIVVGPDKLPDLARSLAKGIMELKKTAEGLKDSFAEEGNPLDDIRPDLEEAAKSLKNNLLEGSSLDFDELSGGVNPPADTEAEPYTEVIEKDNNLSPNDDAASVSDAGEQPDQPIIDIEVDDLDGNSETKVQS